MADSLEETLRSLTAVSQTLNKSSDLLNESITEVENALKKFNLGIEARVGIYSQLLDDRTGVSHVIELKYGRHQGKWGLLAVDYIDEDPDSTWDERFLREAPREVRLAAIGKLPDLIRVLIQESEKSAREAMAKAEAAREIAAGLSRKPR